MNVIILVLMGIAATYIFTRIMDRWRDREMVIGLYCDLINELNTIINKLRIDISNLKEEKTRLENDVCLFARRQDGTFECESKKENTAEQVRHSF